MENKFIWEVDSCHSIWNCIPKAVEFEKEERTTKAKTIYLRNDHIECIGSIIHAHLAGRYSVFSLLF